jgi:tetratricopeptide (TPR) repeat protein
MKFPPQKTAVVLLAFATVAVAFQPDRAVLRQVYEDHVARCERDFGAGDARTAQAARDLGFFLRDSGDPKSAVAPFSKALKIDQAKFGADSHQSLAGILALASVSSPPDAESLLRRALASKSMNSQLAVPALSTLGDLRLAAGDPLGAAACWRLSLQHAESVFGKESDEVSKILFSLSQVVDTNESVELLERTVAIARHAWGERHPETATCEVNLSRALLKAGRNADAAEKARASISVFEASLGPQHPRVSVGLVTLAEAMRAQGDVKNAESLYRRAIEIDRQSLGPNDPRTLQDTRALNALRR